MTAIARLARICLTARAADPLAAFYERALGFRQLGEARRSGAGFESLMGVQGGARRRLVGLGDESVELLEFDSPGRPYPPDAAASDLAFQHFAIVVTDIEAAYRRLLAVPGWRAISREGPVRLPAASGGATAFKFRDPEGHPLELIAFAPGEAAPPWRDRRGAGLHLGIDHSAISVADTARSAAFYEALAFEVAGSSHNRGAEQARLDGLAGPDVEVTALAAAQDTPHVELLCYREARREMEPIGNNDVAATRLVLEASPRAGAPADGPRRVVDPDGHRLLIEPSPGQGFEITSRRAQARPDRPS
jgi:catechol 2,3-dioxygenase-like lactoylglutathione lyase family enzyme